MKRFVNSHSALRESWKATPSSENHSPCERSLKLGGLAWPIICGQCPTRSNSWGSHPMSFKPFPPNYLCCSLTQR